MCSSSTDGAADGGIEVNIVSTVGTENMRSAENIEVQSA